MRQADHLGDILTLPSATGEVALRGVEYEHQQNHWSARGNVGEEPQNPAVPGTPASDRIRVLVVDDDDDVREIVTEHLKERGYAVVAVSTGRSACDVVRNDETISIVVSDVMMPGMDGVTLARLLRSQMPGLPIVFITGYSKTHDLRGEIVLAKPFTADALGVLVAKGLARGGSTVSTREYQRSKR